MKVFRIAACSVAVLALASCSSTKVTAGQTYNQDKLARPDRILVYDFAATLADLPSWSAPARKYSGTTSTPAPQELEKGRELGAKIASSLVDEIRGMGLPAFSAAGQTPKAGDVMLVGYFESIDEGSAAKRVVLGFGSGGAELKTQVEGYLMTDEGARELGSRNVDAGAGKAPGVAVPLAVTAATHNPIGLVVGTAMHVGGEATGKSTIEGSAQRTAKTMGEELKTIFQKNGWI